MLRFGIGNKFVQFVNIDRSQVITCQGIPSQNINCMKEEDRPLLFSKIRDFYSKKEPVSLLPDRIQALHSFTVDYGNQDGNNNTGGTKIHLATRPTFPDSASAPDDDLAEANDSKTACDLDACVSAAILHGIVCLEHVLLTFK